MFSSKKKAGLVFISAIILVLTVALLVLAIESEEWKSVSKGGITVDYAAGVTESDALQHVAKLEEAVEFLRSSGVPLDRRFLYRDALVSSWPQFLESWGRGAEPLPWYGADAGRYVTSLLNLALMPYANSCNMLALERYYETRLSGGDLHAIAASLQVNATYLKPRDMFTGLRSDIAAQEAVWMAASFLAYVDEQYGTERLLAFTENMTRAVDFPAASQQHLGVKGDEVENGWLSFIEGKRQASSGEDGRRLNRNLVLLRSLGPETNRMLFDAAGVGYSKNKLLLLHRRAEHLSASPDVAGFERALEEYVHALKWARWGRRLAFVVPVLLVVAVLIGLIVRTNRAAARAARSVKSPMFFDHVRGDSESTKG